MTIDDKMILNNAMAAHINAYGRIGLSVDVSHKVILLKDTVIQWILKGYVGCNQMMTINE